jgi:hypothetical protein
MVAHQLVPPAPLVASNDNRRKNVRQRAGASDNLIWMQKVASWQAITEALCEKFEPADFRISRDGKRTRNTQCEVTGVSIRQILLPTEDESWSWY